MYNAKIITDAGKEFRFGYDDGCLFDISPLSGSDVNITTSQGFQQIGVTVEGQNVGSVRRTIRGTILNKATETKMLSVLPVFTTGRLYVNDTRFCNITVNKTPEIRTSKWGKKTFSMQVFCDTPFWSSAKDSLYIVSNFKKSFTFPVTYDSHTFAVRTENAFVNCFNGGDVSVPLSCEFTADAEVTNYGVINVRTLEELRFDDVLEVGEKVKLFYEKGSIKATKEDADGNVTGVLGKLTDSSNLFNVKPGDNIFKISAENNEQFLKVNILFRPAFMGVVV